MSYNEIKLGDLITHKKGFAFKSKELTNDGHPIVKVSNFTANSIDMNGCFYIDKNEAQKYKDYQIFYNDIIIATVGSWPNNPNSIVGKVIKVPKMADGAFLNQNSVLLRVKKGVCQLFIYYKLKSKDFSDHLIAGARGSANQASVSLEDIFKYSFNLPDLSSQTRITSILSSLDDKIELNRQTNQTLEAIAQTLFKEMCLPKSEELPEGWREIKLNEIIKIKHGYAFKGEFFSDDETEDILVTPGNFKIGGGFNYSKFKYNSGDFPIDYVFKENDLIVTMTDLSKEGDTLGYSALVPTISGKRLLHNQRVGKIEFDENDFMKYFLYFTMRENNYRSFVLGSATGTTVRHTSPDRICDYTVKLPNEEVLIKFAETIKPILEKTLRHEQEIQTLSTLRDSLLPKLMKGEIIINNL
jgi:type I restriction enzyme S subunit